MAHPHTPTRRWRRVLVTAVAALLAFPGVAAAAPARHGDAFVTRSGLQLRLGDAPFRFGGANIYWLGLDENVGGVDYPTYFRIDDALRTAKAMGATVVRSHTLGISTGNPLSVEPSLGIFNPKAFATIDYAVAAARRLGIRLVVPLADNWAYYHGGRRDFTNWFGLPAEAFYTDPRVIAAYQDYVRHLLAHVNPYTGRAYGAEPTVLAWELGNELDGMPPQWVDTMSSYLHQLAPRHLVAAPGISAATLGSAHVDIVDAHYYPPTAARMLADAAQVTAAGKVYIAGEYGSPAVTDELLAPLAADPRVSGTLFWSLFGRNDTHGYVAHNDGFTVHYPGDTPAMRRIVQAIQGYARAVNPRAGVPAVPLTQPLLTSVSHAFGETVLAWRGVATAVGYTVQRSRRGTGPWATVSSLLSDADTPWIDIRSSTTPQWYRVVAQDAAGRRRASAPLQTDPRNAILVDPLSSWASTATHSDDLVVRPDGDRVAVAPTGRTSSVGRPQITWSHPQITGFALQVRASRRAAAPEILTSVDGARWLRTHPRRSPSVAGRYTLTLENLARVNSVRVQWPARRHGAAEVTGAVLRYAEPAAPGPVRAPSSFAQLDPAAGATRVQLSPRLVWGAADRAGHYSLVVSTRADLSAPLISVTGLRGTTYPVDVKLQPHTRYYWAVTATNVAGSTRSSDAGAWFETFDPATMPLPVEDFAGYGSSTALQAAYVRNTGGDEFTVTLDDARADVAPAMAVAYRVGTAGYAGASHTFGTVQDWSADQGLSFWLQPDGTGRALTVQFQAAGLTWETAVATTGSEPRVVRVPFSDFRVPPWATPGVLDLTQVSQLSLYVGGEQGAGTFYVDSFAAYPAG